MDACGCDPPPFDASPGADEGFAAVFTRRRAASDRERYHRSGPIRTTAMLLDLLRPFRREGTSLLDIGGGIGALDQAFLADGAERATLVEGSSAFLAAAREEADLARTLDRMTFRHGDFVRLAPDVPPADVVTLDRVVCCYPDADALVRLSAARALRAFGFVMPRERLVFRVGAAAANLAARFRRESWRLFAHSNARVDELLAEAGLTLHSEARTALWRVAVYERTGEGVS